MGAAGRAGHSQPDGSDCTSVCVSVPGQVYELEEYRRERLDELATLIQKTWRGWRQHRLFEAMRKSQIIIASNWRTWKVGGSLPPEDVERHKYLIQIHMTKYPQNAMCLPSLYSWLVLMMLGLLVLCV